MNFALMTRNPVLKTRNCALKMMNFAEDPEVDTQNLVVRDSTLWNQRFGNCMVFKTMNFAI